jgi:glucose/arabinose dehydrogenase
MSVRPSAIMMLVLILGLLVPEAALADFDVPQGFADELVVGGVPSPTGLAWLPASEDEDLLITTQGGGIFRFDGAPPADQLLDLSGTICSGGEMGLLGIAVHPDFDSGARSIYVYYTDRKGTTGSCDDQADRANRVSRFTMNSEGELVDEQVLIDNIAAQGGNHNGGDLQFGRDGLLYISVGDAGRDLRTGETQDDNRNARRLDLLNGKILRITPEGAIPASNPFQGPGTARCNQTGQLERQGQGVEAEKKTKKQRRRARKRKKRQRQNQRPATVCREIFATGLRNPYRIAFDPNDNAGPQRFFINDVGGGGFEEINEGQAGADYGWNVREGFCPIGNIGSNCSGSGQFDDPIFAYRTRGTTPPFNNCGTITGGAFVAGGDWPADYLFADFRCDTLFALTEVGSGVDVEPFVTGEGATHLAFGPDGALYYTTFSSGGQVRRIVDQPGP